MARCVPWTIKEVNFLRELVNKRKLSAIRIYRGCYFIGRTQGAISSQMSYLGLGSPAFKERMKNCRRLSKEEKEKLFIYLHGKGRNMPNCEVMEKLGIRDQVVCGYRRRWGLKLSSKISFTTKRFKRTHRKVVAALRKGLADYRLRRPMRYRAKLVGLFRQMAEAGCEIPYKRCVDCGEYWYATDDFFYHARWRVKRQLYNHCKACGFPWTNRKRQRARNIAA